MTVKNYHRGSQTFSRAKFVYKCMSLYLNMANMPVNIWGKLSQYALQILDFTLNMPHEILGPVAPPPPPS